MDCLPCITKHQPRVGLQMLQDSWGSHLYFYVSLFWCAHKFTLSVSCLPHRRAGTLCLWAWLAVTEGAPLKIASHLYRGLEGIWGLSIPVWTFIGYHLSGWPAVAKLWRHLWTLWTYSPTLWSNRWLGLLWHPSSGTSQKFPLHSYFMTSIPLGTGAQRWKKVWTWNQCSC